MRRVRIVVDADVTANRVTEAEIAADVKQVIHEETDYIEVRSVRAKFIHKMSDAVRDLFSKRKKA